MLKHKSLSMMALSMQKMFMLMSLLTLILIMKPFKKKKTKLDEIYLNRILKLMELKLMYLDYR
jgi:hypothetical protein